MEKALRIQAGGKKTATLASDGCYNVTINLV